MPKPVCFSSEYLNDEGVQLALPVDILEAIRNLPAGWTGEEYLKEINLLVRTFFEKNFDYVGDDAQDCLKDFMEVCEFGMTPVQGIVPKLIEKWSRIRTLTRRKGHAPFVVDEKLSDTMLDMANYLIFGAILTKRTINKD